MTNRIRIKLMMSIIIALMISSGSYNYVADANSTVSSENKIDDWENGIKNINKFQSKNATYDEEFNVGSFLSDAENSYSQKWDPWMTKAAIHAVATTDDGDMMALAGGYLYDNEIHLYRWNYVEDQYDLVWEIGNGIFQSDVTTIKFADTNYNQLIEIIAGSEDGRVYVFEQRHIYDANTNMENQFDLVWKSPRLGRVIDLVIEDTDGDSKLDIIVGTGDKVTWFEYIDHSNYPFNKEHWTNYEITFSYNVPSQVTALGISDVNENSMTDIVVGMRSGEIIIIENNGTILDIDGSPFALLQDNSYKETWSSGNLISYSISDMAGGDLDNDGIDELLIAVQGQGAYILDTFDGELAAYRLEKPFDSWEANPMEMYPLDYYVDQMVSSSSITMNDVFYDNGSIYKEPLDLSLGIFDNFPYNSHAAMETDGLYTTMKTYSLSGQTKESFATWDFGQDEEAMGNGIPSLYDLVFTFPNFDIFSGPSFDIQISQDGINFIKVNSTYFEYEFIQADNFVWEMRIEIDPTLASIEWDYYRYVKIYMKNSNESELHIDSIRTMSVYRPLDTALSTIIGDLILPGKIYPIKTGFIGTVDGSISGVIWNDNTNRYEIVWDSYQDERWKLNKNLFDLAVIKQKGRFPTLLDIGDETFSLDVDNLPFGGKMISYTADNFYNYKYENNLEYIISSTNGEVGVFTQSSDRSKPVYNQELTNMLFRYNDYGYDLSVENYMSTMKDKGAKYFTFNLVPIETTFVKEFIPSDSINDPNFPRIIDPVTNGYWLFIGSWDGYVANEGLGTYSSTEYINDVAIFYLTQRDMGEQYNPLGCDIYSNQFDQCSYFQPLFNYTWNTGVDYYTFTDMELTGVMSGIFRESSWMPKITASDMIGESFSDYILTNGKLHLLEAIYDDDAFVYSPEGTSTINNQLQSNIDMNIKFLAPRVQMNNSFRTPISFDFAMRQINSRFELTYKGDYFKEINENSNGRVWTNANPVDFDGDGDFDLVIGFARYNTTYFDFDKQVYGITYWENQGSREDPVWVEIEKAVNNNDPNSNFRVQNYTEPVMVWDEYIFSNDFEVDPEYGYHPLYKSIQPTKLLMFQASDQQNIFNGTLEMFRIDYSQPTSLLAATYPDVNRIDINLQNWNIGIGSTDIRRVNFGYHIMDTWSNDMELNDWTLSMSTADLDQDGKNEIIVGDYSNNIYVFEHMTNNTFKRSFKSFNVNHTIETDSTPYAFKELPGVGDNFNRTIFDHVKQLIAGFDLNKNGRLEFVATTDTMIFVFESVLSSTGRIRDDTYRLISVININEIKSLNRLYVDKSITSIAFGEDITSNGKNELIVAVNSALLIFEISNDDGSNVEDINVLNSEIFQYEEIFMGADWKGLYNLPGNYHVLPQLRINSLLVSDIDKNGRIDIILGGVDKTEAKSIWSGFISIMRWNGFGFEQIIDENEFESTTLYNPINDLDILDSDYDGVNELIIAHDKGVDIYEINNDKTVKRVEVISSDPSYNFEPTSYSFENNEIHPDTDQIRLLDGSLVRVTIHRVSNKFTKMEIRKSTNDGLSWPSILATINYIVSTREIEQVSMVENIYGDIWLSFVSRENAGNIDVMRAHVVRISSLGIIGTIYTTFGANIVLKDQKSRMNPRVIIISSDQDVIGLIYRKSDNGLKLVTINYGSQTDFYTQSLLWFNPSNSSNFYVDSFDIIKNPTTNGLYDVVFAGYRIDEKLTLNTDLYHFTIRADDTSYWIFTNSQPNRMYDTGLSVFHPSIIREFSTNNLIVSFEQNTLRPYGGLFSIWSNNDGNTWSEAYDMAPKLGFDTPRTIVAYSSISGETYRAMTILGNSFLSRFTVLRPVLSNGRTQGFTMSYYLKFDFSNYSDFGICNSLDTYNDKRALLLEMTNIGCGYSYNYAIANVYNPDSSFTEFNINKVQKITVGDSDMDGRKEILMASGKTAILAEFNDNTIDNINFVQKWKSKLYNRDITEIVISDANGNGLPELIIESDRGIINSYETSDKSFAGTSQILKPKLESKLMVYDNNNNLVSKMISDIKTIDINNDNIDEIIVSTEYGDIAVINGKTKSQMYFIKGENSAENYKLRNLYILSENGSPKKLVRVYGSILSTYELLTGELIDSTDYGIGVSISSIDVSDIINGGFEEIVVGISNGIVQAFTHDLTSIWSKSYTLGAALYPFTADISNIKISNFVNTNKKDIAISTISQNIIMIDSSTGDQIWSNQGKFHTSIHVIDHKMTTVDLNGDGLDEIIIGANRTYAFDGKNGDILWDVLIYDTGIYYQYGAVSREPVIIDINNDGVKDIIYSLWALDDLENTVSIAIDGRLGKILWKYEKEPQDQWMSYVDIKSDIFLEKELIVIAGGNTAIHVSNNASSIILDPITGKALAALPQEVLAFTNDISNLDKNYNQIITGDIDGLITIYSIWQNDIDPTPEIILNGKAEPFISVGKDFTERTKFLLEDITGDSIDDIIAVDDYYVGIADTFRLENDESYNDVIWSNIDISFGKFLGSAEVLDFNGDDILDIAIAFSTGLYIFNLITGKQIYYHEYSGESSGWSSFYFEVYDWSSSGGMDIIYSQNIINSYFIRGISRKIPIQVQSISTEYGVISSINKSPIYKTISKQTSDGIFEVNDINDDNKLELIIYATSTFNKVVSNFTILSNNFDKLFEGDGLPDKGLEKGWFVGSYPISHLAVGDFNTQSNTKQIILFNEVSKLNNKATNIPTMFLLFDYYIYDGYMSIPNTDALAFSPIKSATKEYTVIDINGDGIDDILGEAETGDLFQILYGVGGKPFINIPNSNSAFVNELKVNGVPSANTRLLYGEFCGENSFVQVNSYNTIACYDNFNFTIDLTPKWTVTIDIKSIKDIVSGDIDKETSSLKNDLIVIGIDGYVWIINDVSFSSQLDLSGNIMIDDKTDVLINLSRRSSFIILIPLMILILIILKKRKLLIIKLKDIIQ